MHLGDLRNFQSLESSNSFFYSFNDTIYKITNKGDVFPSYYIDFGNHKLPETYLNENYGNIMEFLEPLKKTDYAYRIIGFLETNGFMAFGFMNKGEIPHFYYSISDNKGYLVNSISYDLLLPGLVMKASIDNLPMAVSGGKLYSIINANTLIKEIDSLRMSMSTVEWDKYSETKGL